MDSPSIAGLIEESVSFERSGQMGVALERVRQALDLARARGDADGIAGALVRLGDLHYRLGHFDETIALCRQALDHAGEVSRPRVSALIALGNCAMEAGPLSEAESYYQAAADLSRQIGWDHSLVSALHDLAAGVYALRGQFGLAIAAEEEAYRIACRVNSSHRPVPLISIAFDCMLTGEYERAQECLDELAPLVAGDYRWDGYLTWLRAYLAQLVGEVPVAIELYAEARSVADTTGDLGLNVFLRLGLSGCHQLMGNPVAAYDWAGDAVAWASRAGTRRFLGRALTERGRSAWLKGDLADAECDFRAAIRDLSDRQQAYDLARARLLLAALAHAQGLPEADTLFDEAITLIVRSGLAALLERERGLAFPLVAAHLSRAEPAMQAICARLLDDLVRVPPPPLRITALGRFEVFRRGVAIPAEAWRRQAGELFRLLLISPGRSLAREQVIDALWPDKAPSAAGVFFYQATSVLRRALEPDLPDKFPSRYLLVEEGQITLFLPSGSQVDFEAFEAHGRVGDWEAALRLYEGEPFVKDRYHEWASWKREQLTQLGLRAMLGAATRSLDAGEAGEALGYCRRILVEEPWHEHAALLGMRACLKLDDRPGAVRLYLALERCIREEFGIRPMPALRELYESLL